MSHDDDLANLEWQEREWFGLETGTLAFTDARARPLIDEGAQLQWPSQRATELGSIGQYPCAAWAVGDDCPIQIEVANDSAGTATAVRVETVSDVADLDGSWLSMTEISFPTGQAMVCDPGCRDSYYWRPVDVRPGLYRVELFQPIGDRAAGFRMIWSGSWNTIAGSE